MSTDKVKKVEKYIDKKLNDDELVDMVKRIMERRKIKTYIIIPNEHNDNVTETIDNILMLSSLAKKEKLAKKKELSKNERVSLGKMIKKKLMEEFE